MNTVIGNHFGSIADGTNDDERASRRINLLARAHVTMMNLGWYQHWLFFFFFFFYRQWRGFLSRNDCLACDHHREPGRFGCNLGGIITSTGDTHQQLDQLKKLGVTLAMDDFGTGYSSLSYLKKFPIDIIKIDRSFIHEIPDNQDDMEITSAVIAMAHNLKLKVVAEGIETAAQLGFLRRQQCDVGQGYLFDRPIPGRDLVGSLRRYPCRGA